MSSLSPSNEAPSEDEDTWVRVEKEDKVKMDKDEKIEDDWVFVDNKGRVQLQRAKFGIKFRFKAPLQSRYSRLNYGLRRRKAKGEQEVEANAEEIIDKEIEELLVKKTPTKNPSEDAKPMMVQNQDSYSPLGLLNTRVQRNPRSEFYLF